jgi:hypothetical protein
MRPESIPNPGDAGCNSQLAQYSNTPSLRVPGFEDEDDDEDENEAPRERRQKKIASGLLACQFDRAQILLPLRGRWLAELLLRRLHRHRDQSLRVHIVRNSL